MPEPLDFITRLREIYPERYADFSAGCLKFHLLLQALYPHCKGWYDSKHIITEIDGVFYDIDGVAEKGDAFLPLTEYGMDNIRQFTETHRHNEVKGCH